MTRTKHTEDSLYRSYLRSVLKLDGLRGGMLDIHDYLLANRGWQSSHGIAHDLDVVPATVFRWANILVGMGFLERTEAVGIQEDVGGREPAEFRANLRKSKVPLRKKYERLAKEALAKRDNWR